LIRQAIDDYLGKRRETRSGDAFGPWGKREIDIIALDEAIAERAVSLRRSHHIKLPDAIIWATAQVHAMLLVTRNTRDFTAGDPGIRMPYRL
jgi:predicted nucleic acid-binding protein